MAQRSSIVLSSDHVIRYDDNTCNFIAFLMAVIKLSCKRDKISAMVILLVISMFSDSTIIIIL